MPLEVQGSLHTLNANKHSTKPSADHKKSQGATSKLAGDIRAGILKKKEFHTCQGENQQRYQPATRWVPRIDDVNQGSLTDDLGKHASVQMGCIPWVGSEWPAVELLQKTSGHPGQLLWFSKLRHWNHASGLVSVQFWPDKFTKSWNLTT